MSGSKRSHSGTYRCLNQSDTLDRLNPVFTDIDRTGLCLPSKALQWSSMTAHSRSAAGRSRRAASSLTAGAYRLADDVAAGAIPGFYCEGCGGGLHSTLFWSRFDNGQPSLVTARAGASG